MNRIRGIAKGSSNISSIADNMAKRHTSFMKSLLKVRSLREFADQMAAYTQKRKIVDKQIHAIKIKASYIEGKLQIEINNKDVNKPISG